MSDEPQEPAHQLRQTQSEDQELRESAWLVAQQAAQMVGEVGVGLGGAAGAVQVIKGLVGGSKSGDNTPNPQQDQTPSNDK